MIDINELVEIDKLSVTVLLENNADGNIQELPKNMQHEDDLICLNKPDNKLIEKACLAADGLSLLLEIYIKGNIKRVMFDAGSDGKILIHNIKTLGLDSIKIDDIILSHGHADHIGGLKNLLRSLVHKPNLHINEQTLQPKGVIKEDGTIREFKITPTQDDLNNISNLKINNNERVIVDKTIFLSGEITREWKKSEIASKRHMVRDNTNNWVHDPFVLDERYIVLNIKEKGLIVFTACTHAGIINVLEDINKYYSQPIYAVIGGWHTTRYSSLINCIIGELGKYQIKYLFLGHCTGLTMLSKLLHSRGDFNRKVSDQTTHPLFTGMKFEL